MWVVCNMSRLYHQGVAHNVVVVVVLLVRCGLGLPPCILDDLYGIVGDAVTPKLDLRAVR